MEFRSNLIDETNDDEGKVVVCMRISDANQSMLVEGAKPGACQDCHKAVWMSPSTVAALSKLKNIRALCHSCVDELLRKNPSPDHQVGLLQGAKEELLQKGFEIRQREEPK